MYCIYQRLWNQAIQFLRVWSYHSYEYGWGCRQQGFCATRQTLLEQVEWKRLCQNYFGPWPTTGAANLRKQSTARRAHPLGAMNGTRLRLWRAGPGDERRHLCPGQYYPGPGCTSTGLHSHVKESTAHPGHTPSLPPPFSCSLWRSPSSFSLQAVSKDLLSHWPLSPPPFLPGPQCQHIPTPPWPRKYHNTISFRFSHIHAHISSCHQQAWEKSHRITLCHLESTF